MKMAIRGELPVFLAKAFEHDGDGCLIWPFNLSNGYGTIRLDGRNEFTHRLVCKHFNGQSPTPKHHAAHSCGNRACLNGRHLSWKTRAENEADKIAHGRTNRGERCGNAKLTEANVREIREQRGRVPPRELAGRYGVSTAAIYSVQTGTNWRWL